MTLGVIGYARITMGRWQPDAVGRLVHAAMTLFGERGFENTTVTEIAEQAGLTKRTFFRYFADKREVLFYGADQLEGLFVTAVVEAPAAATPLEAVTAAIQTAAAMFEERREFAVKRQTVIAANPELQERELIKLASLATAVAQALRRRGVGDPAAILTAEAGITIFRVAFERWAEPGNAGTFDALVRDGIAELRAVASA
jgi:AcrR family transcriptional regulator